MRFEIKNIGAIVQADIDVDGITIIAGENNVGKSTVGKALYAFLHNMNSWKRFYDDICSTRIEHFLYQNSSPLEDWCMKTSGAKRRRTSRSDQLQKKYSRDENFLVAIEDYQINEGDLSTDEAKENVERFLKNYCIDYISLYSIDHSLRQSQIMIKSWIEKVLKDIRLLELDELEIQMQQLKQSFREIFNSQYRRIGSSESQLTFIDDNGRKVQFNVSDEKEELDQPVRVSNHIFFIESPKIYDLLSDTRYGYMQKEYLRYLMSPNIFKKNNQEPKFERQEYVVEQIDNNKNSKEITDRLERVMGGHAEFLQKIGLEFKDKNISEPIHSVNVSTGLKSMALLEYALRIGAIEEGDILILDEPEINLHPEWQVEYARTLVNLQKEFHLKIIITTHSPYFMRAIECFADINDTMEKLNVYRVNKSEGRTLVENVSYSEFGMTDLYDALSAPLEELESLLDEKYGMEE
ncbi:MAG: AAA family ATPase [Clostridia bacterium]|nr:AAA family ATPase [Clostridia bacterium]MDY5554744.1 AAA family ATPase [Blautia sp.]